jgi:hypothetical protein
MPLATRCLRSDVGGQNREDGEFEQKVTKGTKQDALHNSGGEDPKQRFRWKLGASPDGRHCPSCEALAGQVHTQADWDAAALSPGTGGLFCQGNCHCTLVKTDDPISGTLGDTPQRTPEPESGDDTIADRSSGEAVMANAGWGDEARAASIAVRRAKAAARRAAAENESDGNDAGDADSDAGEKSLSDMTPDEIDARTEQIRQKLRDGKPLSSVEEEFLIELTDAGYAGESDGDPVFEWQERHSAEETQREREEQDRSVEGIHDRAEELMGRESDGETLSEEDRRFLERYREVVGDRDRRSEVGGQRSEVGGQRPERLRNAGWGDRARAASIQVRRAKAAARKVGKEHASDDGPEKKRPVRKRDPLPLPPQVPIDDGGMIWPGGSPYFDERTGQYVYPVPQPPNASPVPSGPPQFVTYPSTLRFDDPQEWQHQGIPADAQTLRVGDGGAVLPWQPGPQVAADKVRRRLVMQRNG